MISRPVLLGLVAAGTLTAAAGGAYVAVRHNATDHALATIGAPPVAASAEASSTDAPKAVPVAETEAIVTPSSTASKPAAQVENARPAAPKAVTAPAPRSNRSSDRRPVTAERSSTSGSQTASRGHADAPLSHGTEAAPAAATVRPDPLPEPVRLPDAPASPPERQFVEVVVPSASVIGLQMDTSLSSERAKVEDRVEARVTRDVAVDGRVAIPSGTRVIGVVTVAERGGKIKERARLGVRFHTLVFADGTELPIRTEAISREGDSPGRESSAKIGGAAVGGAILGAILGGGKGAAIGGATGAAGGTAVVMAGDRNAATLPAGTVLTVRLTEPVAVDVEKR